MRNGVDKYALLVEKYYQGLGFNVDFAYIKPSLLKRSIISKFKNSNIIYLAGGDTKYLIERLSSVAILRALKGSYKKELS